MVAELGVQVNVLRAGDVTGGEGVLSVGVGERPPDIEDADRSLGGEQVTQGSGGNESHGLLCTAVPTGSR